MDLAARRRSRRLLGLLPLALFLFFGLARAQATSQLPPGIEIELLEGELVQEADGSIRFTGPVVIQWRESRIQADRLSLTGKRYVEAEGNVLIVWEGSRIYGSRLHYDLEEERGVIEDAYGQVLSEYMFWADRVEKIGTDKVFLESATVTTCTQPVPYWSFSVSSATIRIDHYARMWNVRLRARKAPIFYLPYLIWPVKEGRAAGLLLPEFHTTRTRGRVLSQELFIPLGRSADVTLLGRYYTEAGFGGGGQVRFIPNHNGSAILNGFYIYDKVYRQNPSDLELGAGRYRASYLQEQRFLNGFRMVADINWVSDFDYFSDFERELNLVSSPTIKARLEFSRNDAWTSLNIRELRLEQLFADESRLIQQTLPEIEWRGRSRRLGGSPLYLSFESSLASIQQRGQLAPAGSTSVPGIDADYLRGDVYPTLTLPWSPVNWLDITPTLSYRLTHYTQHQEGSGSELVVADEALTRGLLSYGVELVGPKVFRLFERPNRKGAPRYKHSIEPRLLYGFAEAFEGDQNRIILYDEVDRFSGSGNQMTYSLVQRLFARRPRARPQEQLADQQGVLAPIAAVGADATLLDPSLPPPAGTPEPPRPEEPVEIASLELQQTRSFDREISTADLDGDGQSETTSPFSDVTLAGRFNPSRSVSLDLRSRYDILFHSVRDVSLSGNLRNPLSHLRLSLVHREGLGVVRRTALDPQGMQIVTFDKQEDATQLRLTGGMALLNGRLLLDIDGSYDANPGEGLTNFPEKRWRVEYRTQCCTFRLERFTRDFSTIEDRRELYFRVDLQGLGKLLDYSF